MGIPRASGSISAGLHLPERRAWVRRRLLTWFARDARALPWRLGRDPYAILVSEVMLQQTQVATVIPYFQRFLAAFPTLTDLARADLELVLRHWEGLGYYRRARNLHRAAQIMHTEHGGKVPACPEALSTLPGLGRYTVGAVLSQAFDLRLPILEANSVRVLCRFLGVSEDPKQGSVRKRLWAAAAALLPAKRSGQFNQALMELGALVCKPHKPACPVCPLNKHCEARRTNQQDAIPQRTLPVPVAYVREVALVVRRGEKVLLARRPSKDRWAGLWEFPRTPLGANESTLDGASRLLRELGLEVSVQEPIVTIKHAVTRFRITLICLAARFDAGRFKSAFYTGARWLRRRELADLPVSSPQRRLADLI